MKQLYLRMMMLALLIGSVSSWANEVVFDADSIAANTDSITDPKWYVAPVIPASLRAPMRTSTAAASCKTDSVLTFNVDSVLTDVTVYEYDEAGRTVGTLVWTCNTDGSRVGKSRTEDRYDASGTKTMTATYVWDNMTNDWKGNAKTEYTFENGKNTVTITFDWLNGDWSAKTRYNYAYDATGREIEYIYYTRNAASMQLVPAKSRIREYNAAGKMTLEIQYTAHDGTGWYAGTKKEYDYDAAGNQTEYTYYGSLSNSNWIGSTHEVWTYNAANQKTYYKKETWNSGAWLTSNEEFTTYDVEGQISSLEKYALKSGKLAGSMKEEYVYNDEGAEMSRISYKWTNNAWVKNLWALTNNELPDNTYETCNYSWKNEAWVGTGTRTLKTYNTSDRLIEQITQTWPTNATDWVNSTRNTTDYSGSLKIQEASYTWQNNAWKGINRTDYHYNAAKKNDTTTTFTYANADWVNETRVVNTYDAKNNLILVHNASWSGSAWTMTSMSRTDLIYSGSKQVMKATWTCASDSVWVGTQKDTTAYNAAGKQIYTARFTFNTTTMDWKPSTKTETEYDSKNRQIDKRTYSWDATKNDWKGTSRTEMVYDANGNKLMEATYNGWVAAINDWKGNKKTEKTFAANNLVSSMVLSNWNTSTNTWLLKTRYTYVYDNSKREILQTVENYTNNAWVNANQYEKEYKNSILVKDNTYMWLNGQWVYSARKESYYDEDAQSKLRREITGSWSNGIVNTFTDNSYSYECDPRTIRFVNYDGTLLETQTLDKGVTPSYSGAEPTRESNAEYTYAFSGWSPTLAPVTTNITYTATYTATKKTYTITWKNDDGSIIESETLEYGATPTHADINKESTAEYTYTFAGWTPQITAVTGDAEYTATFTVTKNSYTITWLNDDGFEIDHETLEYGAMPAHTDINKENTAEWTYTFAGWEPEIVAVVGDASYTAKFDSTKNSYTITFYSGYGTILEQMTVEYGQIPVCRYTPSLISDDFHHYDIFTGWTPEIVPATCDASYTPTFELVARQYTITFRNYNGKELQSAKVDYGTMPEYTGETPERIGSYPYSYIFTGWDPELVPVSGDAVYKASYKATLKTQGINGTEAGETATKVIIDNQIFIRRGGNIYTIDGQRVK